MAIVVFEKEGVRGYGVLRDGGVAKLPVSSLAEALEASETVEGEVLDLSEVTLLPPVEPTAKILCVALNYVDHAKEAEQPIPESPIIFFKSTEAMISGGDDIDVPGVVNQIDYEGEIAIIIGKGGFEIAKEDVWDHIAGVSAFNDVSGRNIFKVKAGSKEHLDWFSAKCLNSSTPMGPEVIALDDVVEDLKAETTRVRTLVNEEVRQDAVIKDMIFDIPTLVSFASTRIRLSPGDIIATGTPPGVGAGTGRYISTGDTVKIEITGLPTLENRVG